MSGLWLNKMQKKQEHKFLVSFQVSLHIFFFHYQFAPFFFHSIFPFFSLWSFLLSISLSLTHNPLLLFLSLFLSLSFSFTIPQGLFHYFWGCPYLYTAQCSGFRECHSNRNEQKILTITFFRALPVFFDWLFICSYRYFSIEISSFSPFFFSYYFHSQTLLNKFLDGII